MSSNQALQRARRVFQAKKAGHTGSLDPLASGLLPLCFGEATKVAGFLLDEDKTYVATLSLGARTTTGDAEGEVIETMPVPDLLPDAVTALLQSFEGPIDQVPPMYSALKHEGQALYRLARQGIEVPREARRVTIHALRLVALQQSGLTFEVRCSKGTYVRTLGEDIAKRLGTVGHLTALRRTGIGSAFDQVVPRSLDSLEALIGRHDELDRWLLPIDSALTSWPSVDLDAIRARAASHGQEIPVSGIPGTRVRLYGPDRAFLGMGMHTDSGTTIRPLRLLSSAPDHEGKII
jgi:tRNA pseudouridine55 synthase